ncbi:hypothetical protein [Runella salmonicolor]|uniref:Lipocalin-like domain-containing protein n=1 Tax=Runella salmonicolor TaxID=2950278 RepID=A0ABT1FH24_9BACT|nr:hypothetical protein [Runella salmonicolor]MCP1381067.1 hypothetical protein [Runella salmonicolor]
MKTYKSLLSISALALMLIFSGCTNNEVEPDPADQVIGAYSATTYSESINGVAQSIDLTNAVIKENVAISFDVAKKAASTLTVVLSISQRDSTGTMQTYNDTYDSIELKALGNGNFEMLNAGTSVGQIGNGNLSLEETYPDTDESGNTVQVTVKIAATKSL